MGNAVDTPAPKCSEDAEAKDGAGAKGGTDAKGGADGKTGAVWKTGAGVVELGGGVASELGGGVVNNGGRVKPGGGGARNEGMKVVVGNFKAAGVPDAAGSSLADRALEPEGDVAATAVTVPPPVGA